jgi:hypothetical protein
MVNVQHVEYLIFFNIFLPQCVGYPSSFHHAAVQEEVDDSDRDPLKEIGPEGRWASVFLFSLNGFGDKKGKKRGSGKISKQGNFIFKN